MFSERTSVGLDVHARSVVAAALDTVTGEVVEARLSPDVREVVGWLARLPGPVAVAYEAGPTGFGLFRAISGMPVRCVVVAPSKLLRPAGDRVKTDRRDALHLARLLRTDQVVEVTVPSVEQEAARDLVRAREACRADLMRARHRLSKLLLRHGVVYSGGAAWTVVHDRWLQQQRFDNPQTRATFDAYYDQVL
ncbi:MAG TPA: IS110 family transposase, partial [Propionibacteriaceae bacterium]|nr:IS110 family transposase [Propionibacteriaceae bacterium]HBY23121.1 IS110 family transposase [Propionibacteriaceae bacterium]